MFENSITNTTINLLQSEFKESLTEYMIPAFVKCFGIIIIGYIFGCSKLLNQYGTKSLCLFVQYLALPALIFTSLATISTSNINWQFVAAILVSKIIVFTITSILTMIMTQPVNLGKSGIYAIASTQSNDLALGYPLMVSLYRTSHPTFPPLLYVITSIQLLILNPIGFFLLEAFKRKNNPQYSQEHSMYVIFKEIIKNPLIIATVLGMVWNFTFEHYVPPCISELLNSLGMAFSPVALFLLGHSMCRGIKAVNHYFSLIPATLVLAKNFVLPLVIQKTIEIFLSNVSESEMQDYSSLGFLYGTFPAPPTIFIFAKQYNVAVNTIASVTVYSTLLSAPLMIISATMISLAQKSFQNIEYHLRETVTYVSMINLCCCILVLLIIIVKKKWRDICITSIIYIMFAQILLSIGGTLLVLDSQNKFLLITQYILSLSGLILSRLFAVFLGFLIFLLQKKSLCFVLRYKIFINIVMGFILPVCVTVIIVSCLMQDAIFQKFPNYGFQLDYSQVITILPVTIVALILTAVFLVLQHRYMKHNNFNENTESADINQSLLENEYINHPSCASNNNFENEIESIPQMIIPVPSDIEDVANEFEEIIGNVENEIAQQKMYYKPTCDTQNKCNSQQRSQCTPSQVENYNEILSTPSTNINAEYVRHVIILMSISTSMIISIATYISWMITKTSSGICIELKFLDAILTYSQGIICIFLYAFNDILQLLKNCYNLRRI